MNIVDSSGWLEYFGDSANAGFYAPVIQQTGLLLVPSITLLEVYKRLATQRGHDLAIQAVAAMQQGQVIAVDAETAILAAQVGLRHRLPMADSIIYATGLMHHATVWTQDSDFKDLPGVRYCSKH